MSTSKLKPYSEYKAIPHAGIIKIPNHWNSKRMRFVFKNRGEVSKDGSEELLSVSKYYGVKIRSTKTDREARADSLVGYKKCEPGDIVSNIMRAWNSDLGVAFDSGIVSPAYEVYVPQEQIDPDFLDLLLRTPEYAVEFKRNSRGIGDSRLRLYTDSFNDIQMILPTLDEQKQIGSFVHRINETISRNIANLETQISLLEEKHSALITQAVTKGLNPDVPMKDSEIEWIEQYPTHWMRSRIRKASNRVTDGAHVSPDESGRDIPFVSIIDITNGIIDFENSLRTSAKSFVQHKKHNSCPKPCDVLFSKDGTIGVTAVIREEIDFVASSSLVIISPITDLVDSKYLDYWLRSNLIMEMVERVMSGSALRRISVRKVGDLPILLPPVQEQLEIAEYLERIGTNIDNAINFIFQKIYTLKEYRTAIISAAVMGTIDLRGWAGTGDDG